MKSGQKHREVSQRLTEEIAAGKYSQTGRLPSEVRLVERFGVSRPTVARALRDLESGGLIERRAGSGTYVRQSGLPMQGDKVLGLLIPGLGTTEIFGTICGELAGLARAEEYTLLWGDSAAAAAPQAETEISPEHALKLGQQFIERRVSGVFFAPFESGDGAQANHRITELFARAGVPVVLLDRDIVPFPARSAFDVVGINDVAAGHLLANHLVKLGCRHIAFVTVSGTVPTVAARICGVREALLAARLEFPPDAVHIGNPAEARFVHSLTAGRRWDAVICANDLTAAQLLQSLTREGIRVPQELRLAGFDDVRFASLLSVPLTTVHQPCRELAVTAFRTLLERIAEPTLPFRSQALTPRLVVRESCGAYLQGA
ncbi:MAG: GntR family transcriptional regulator [Verrucomicrobiae bacterium]|nr:GntR family transcriptional regulator [Verrucomicrobiae bacterium]